MIRYGKSLKLVVVPILICILFSISPFGMGYGTVRAETTGTTLLTKTTGDEEVDEAVNTILAEGKGAFLFFYTEGCEYCEKLKPILEDMIQRKPDNLDLIPINSEEYSQVFSQFGSTGCPDLYLIFAIISDGYLYVRMPLPDEESLITKESVQSGSSTADTTDDCKECEVIEDLRKETSLQQTVNGILDEDQHVFIFFFADWCHFCQDQKTILRSLEEDYGDEIQFLWLNEKDYLGDINDLGIEGFPTMYLITRKGSTNYYKKFSGYTSETILKENINFVLGRTETTSVADIGPEKTLTYTPLKMTIDIPETDYPAIAGTVYNFVDQIGIEGVTVNLTGTVSTISAVTDSEGEYNFTNLSPDEYTIEEVNPSGYSSITDDTIPVTISGNGLHIIDFADIPTTSLPAVGGRVYDIGDNGGIAEVKISLFTDCSSNPDCIGSRTALTRADGTYIFTSLEQLNHDVTEIQPSGYSSVSEDKVSLTITENRYYQVDFKDEEFDCNNQWLIDTCLWGCTAAEDVCEWACGAGEDTCLIGCVAGASLCKFFCSVGEYTCLGGCYSYCYVKYGFCDWLGLCPKKLGNCKSDCDDDCTWKCNKCVFDCIDGCDFECDKCIFDCEQNCEFSCQGFGESCNPIDPGFGTGCAAGLDCIPTFGIVTDNAFTCYPGIRSEAYGKDACEALWVKDLAEQAMKNSMTYTFGVGLTLAAGEAHTIEIGNLYGANGDYGCYITTCSGFATDFEGGGFYCFGIINSYDHFEGESQAFAEELSLKLGPFFSVSEVMTVVNDPWPHLVYIGTTNCLGLELGAIPIPVEGSIYECNTAFMLVGKTDGGTLLVYESPSNIAPLVDAGPDITVSEGEMLTITGSFTDSDSFLWTGIASFGDGSGSKPVFISENTFSTDHIYNENGVYNVEVNITDERGNTGTDMVEVIVNNVAPTLDEIEIISPIDENDTTALWIEFTDPGLIDVHEVTIDWGDGNLDTYVIENVGVCSFTVEHQYIDDDPTGTPFDSYTVSVTVTDDDGGSDTESTTVTVSNVAPIITVSGDTIDENGVATVTGTITDPGIEDTFSLTIDWGEGPPETFNYAAGSTIFSETHQYLDDDPTGTSSDDYIITVNLTDDDSEQDSGSTIVTTRNVDPVVVSVTLDQPNPQFVLPLVHTLNFTGTFTDIGTLDVHTAVWDWGDTTTSPGIVDESGGSGTVTGEHVFSAPGTYTVNLTVTDDDTGVHFNTTEVVVVTFEEAKHITVDYIKSLPDEAFKGKADQRKSALENMFSAIDDMWDSGEIWSIVKKMNNNIRSKCDGTVDGKPNNDWIIGIDTQMELCQKIDDMVAYLERAPADELIARGRSLKDVD